MCGGSSTARATLRRSTARQRESRTAHVSPYILAVPSLRAVRSLLTIPVSGTRRPPDCAGGLHVAALRALSESVTRVVQRECLSRATLRRSTAWQRESRTAGVSPYILAVPSLRAVRLLLTSPVSGPGRPPDHRGASCSRVTGSLRVGDASCAAGVLLPAQRFADPRHGNESPARHTFHLTSSLFRRFAQCARSLRSRSAAPEDPLTAQGVFM